MSNQFCQSEDLFMKSPQDEQRKSVLSKADKVDNLTAENVTSIEYDSEIENFSEEVPDKRYDLEILRSLRRIIRAVDIHSRKLKLQYKITAPQLVCLMAVVRDGPLSVSAIAKRVFLSTSTVVGILDRLEQRSLVRRTRDQRDRRLVNVSAMQKGIELVENAPTPLQDGLAVGLKKLTELEQATISLSLERIVELMEVADNDAAPMLETGKLDEGMDEGNLD
jgi:DNA-binding MarR family transcriptional regulator